MPDITRARLKAVVVALFPVIGLVGATLHPSISDLGDNAETARVIADGPTRWAWAHIIEMGANVLAVLAVVAIGSYLMASGERLWSFVAVPLITTGLVLFTAVLGMALLFTAMVEVGAPLVPVMEELEPWYAPITTVILLTARPGFLALAFAIHRSRVLSQRVSRVVVTATVVGALTLWIPTTWGEQLFNVAAIVAFWPLAYRMWVDTTEAPAVVAESLSTA